MSDIKFKENAVCYAYGKQWFVRDNEDNDLISKDGTGFANSSNVIMRKDFQLNEIRTGDFIPASELDTEQKYNDVVEEFGLFGFHNNSLTGYKGLSSGEYDNLVIRGNGFSNVVINFDCKRQLTYNQIIAIGKLKRMMLERQKPALMDDNSVQAKLSNIGNVLHNLSCLENDEDLQGELYNYASYLWDLSKSMVNEKPAPKTTPDLTPDKDDQVKSPKHYQLIEGVESIEIIARSMTKEQWKGFCLGNMLKYRIRAGKKDALQQDIEKANFYGELYEMHKDKCYD